MQPAEDSPLPSARCQSHWVGAVEVLSDRNPAVHFVAVVAGELGEGGSAAAAMGEGVALLLAAAARVRHWSRELALVEGVVHHLAA